MSRAPELGAVEPGDIEPGWPRLLTKRQAARYSGFSLETFAGVCPVRPLDFGNPAQKRRWRYDRFDLDRWVETLKGSSVSDPEHWLGRLNDNGGAREGHKAL